MPAYTPQQTQGPSCFDRVKMGFCIGMAVGMSSAALFGGYSALKMGLRGRELVKSMGTVMLQGGGTFGTFMSIGTAIRCWATSMFKTTIGMSIGMVMICQPAFMPICTVMLCSCCEANSDMLLETNSHPARCWFKNQAQNVSNDTWNPLKFDINTDF